MDGNTEGGREGEDEKRRRRANKMWYRGGIEVVGGQSV